MWHVNRTTLTCEKKKEWQGASVKYFLPHESQKMLIFYFAKILQVTVVRPTNVHDGETQARLFVKRDKIEIEGPGGRFVKKN